MILTQPCACAISDGFDEYGTIPRVEWIKKQPGQVRVPWMNANPVIQGSFIPILPGDWV